MKKRFLCIVMILIICSTYVVLPEKAQAATLSDEMAEWFVNSFYTPGSKLATAVQKTLTGKMEPEESVVKSIYSKIAKYVGYADKFSPATGDMANLIHNTNELCKNVSAAIDIVKNYRSMLESDLSIQKTVDALQVIKGFADLWGYGSYLPTGMGPALSAIEAGIKVGGVLEQSYLQENLTMYEYELMIDYYAGNELTFRSAPTLALGTSVTQEQADAMYAACYLKYYFMQQTDDFVKDDSDIKRYYTINYNSNCNDVSNYSYQYDTVNNNWQGDYTMSRNGYIFGGWYWDSACTNKVSGTFDIYDNMTFYAKWVRQYNYTVSNGKATLTNFNGFRRVNGVDETDIVIPATIDGYPVVKIGDQLFYNKKITSVIIPNSVTSIGDRAFCYCRSLTSITIPDSVTSIGKYAFDDCSSLTEIKVSPNNQYYSSENGILFNKDKTILMVCPGRKTGSYTIPNSITSIGEGAFSGCSSLTSITIPDSVTSIGYFAFFWCSSLTSITIPDSVTSIWNHAFYGCNRLTSITIPNGVTSIGVGAFCYCSKLTSITIPDSVTSIGDGPFGRCNSLTEIKVSPNNQYYSSENGILFNKDKTTLMTCPGGKTGSYTIPDSVTSIGYSAFSDCSSLTSITIPDSVTSIGDYAFCYCRSLTDAYYDGTEEDWNKISIGSGNDYLQDAMLHYIPSIGVKVGSGTITAAPKNVDADGSILILAAYKNGRLVDLQNREYYGTEEAFTPTAAYDSVKVMLWDSLNTMQPLAPARKQ